MTGHWIYSTVINIDEWFGFVYLIVNNKTGQKYIGKKQFHNYTTKAIKGKKRKQHIKKESGWKEYTGSCTTLNEDIATIGKDNFTFTILQCLKTRGELSYEEERLQFDYNVLRALDEKGNRQYYNNAIGNKNYGLIKRTKI